MKSSERDLALIPVRGKANKKRRYFNLQNALRRAVKEVVETQRFFLIYDINTGNDVAQINWAPTAVHIIIHSPRRFHRLWRRS